MEERELKRVAINLRRAINDMKRALGIRVITRQERWRIRHREKWLKMQREYMRHARASGKWR